MLCMLTWGRLRDQHRIGGAPDRAVFQGQRAAAVGRAAVRAERQGLFAIGAPLQLKELAAPAAQHHKQQRTAESRFHGAEPPASRSNVYKSNT